MERRLAFEDLFPASFSLGCHLGGQDKTELQGLFQNQGKMAKGAFCQPLAAPPFLVGSGVLHTWKNKLTHAHMPAYDILKIFYKNTFSLLPVLLPIFPLLKLFLFSSLVGILETWASWASVAGWTRKTSQWGSGRTTTWAFILPSPSACLLFCCVCVCVCILL